MSMLKLNCIKKAVSSRLLTLGCEKCSHAKSVHHLYSNIIFVTEKKNHYKPSPDLE